MRKIFFKKIFISLALLAILAVISAGCGTTAPPVTPPPATCTLTVNSQCSLCYGYVYVDAVNYGWISQNGSISVTGLTPGTSVAVQLRDQDNFYSHIEYLVLQPGANIVTFYTW